jgi:putative FmdB family regulatory protein
MRVIRDFECRECGFVFTKLTENREKEHCPRCNGVDTRSIFAPLAIKVHGQGAYTNKMKVT